MQFVDYARPLRKEMLADFKGQKLDTRAQEFWQTWAMFIVGVGLTFIVWQTANVLSPHQYTRADMKAYAQSYFNWAMSQQ